MGNPLGKLQRHAVAFVKSPKGQAMIRQAVEKAKDPATRAKLQRAAEQAKAKINKKPQNPPYPPHNP